MTLSWESVSRRWVANRRRAEKHA